MGKNIQSLVDQDGKPTTEAVSAPGWFINRADIEVAGYSKVAKNRKTVSWGPPFSNMRRGNDVEFITTGAEYFRKVAAAISDAKSAVFIAGWQVNYDVQLDGKKTLFECLLEALKKGADVYVMPWLAPPGPVDTGYLTTMLAIFHLNAHPEAKGRAYCLPAIAQSDQEQAGIVYAHHQKLVVVDNEKAYLGGIDLAYGRRDDENFSLKAEGRTLSEVYNSCVPPIHKTRSVELSDCVTPAELMAAAFTRGKVRWVATFIESQPSYPVALAKDIKDGISDTVGDAVGAVSDYVGSVSLVGDLKNVVQDAYVDTAQAFAQGTAHWAWERLPEEIRNKVKSIVEHQGGNAADAISAVYAWLNGADLSLLPPSLIEETSHAIQALVYGVVAGINTATSIKPAHYQPLFDKVRAVPASTLIVDTKVQPRMPWQDVQCCVKGPSVYDLSRNFVLRWNGIAARFEAEFSRYSVPAAKFLFDNLGLRLPTTPKAPRIASAHMPKKEAKEHGTCSVQVLRSASRRMQKDEALGAGEKNAMVDRAQNNCLKGMVQVIRSAQNFIYIEGQFFQSAHGDSGVVSPVHSGPMSVLLNLRRNPLHQRFERMLGIEGLEPKAMLGKLRWAKIDDVAREAQGEEYLQDLMTVLKNVATVEVMRLLGKPQDSLINPICKALLNRIEQAIDDEEPFHVYLVLPVHPEGTLDTLNIMSQVHLTMHSLAFGHDSLLNGVRRAVLAKRYLNEKKLSKEAAQNLMAAMGTEKLAKAVGDEWKNYLTLLNLRNWDTLNGQPVTEQIYVHSKLLIADDRVAVLGSANINDRSQLGDRDSELAVIVTDARQEKVKLDGVHAVDCGAAIHKLRRSLWEKHFGLKSRNRRAAALSGQDILNSPAAPATWRAIQTVAENNTKNYEKVFWFIPRSGARPEIQPKEPGDNEPGPAPASLWPTWKYETYLDHGRGGRLLYRMPFDPLFWRAAQRGDTPNSWNVGKDEEKPLAPVGRLATGDIQGFITELPVHWTYREDNLSIKTHIGVLAKNEPVPVGSGGTVVGVLETVGEAQV